MAEREKKYKGIGAQYSKIDGANLEAFEERVHQLANEAPDVLKKLRDGLRRIPSNGDLVEKQRKIVEDALREEKKK